MMVGERGWISTAGRVKRPAASSSRSNARAVGDTDGTGMEIDSAMELQESGAEVLEEMLPRRGRRGRGKPKAAVNDDEELGDEDVDGQTDLQVVKSEIDDRAKDSTTNVNVDQARDVSDDSKGGANAEEDADAEGEVDDGEGSADIVDGVIGLEGKSYFANAR